MAADVQERDPQPPYGNQAVRRGRHLPGRSHQDPLSGRSYVYQAMRVTGAGDIYKPVSETLPGKLPQKVITRKAAQGYSSYGNQIGLATTHVRRSTTRATRPREWRSERLSER